MDAKLLEELIKTILTPPVLLAVMGGIISLMSSYIPRFREWYASLVFEQKALTQLGIITSIVLLSGVLSWTGVIMIVPVGTAGILILVFSWIAAVIANQATYALSKPVPSVIVIKDKQKKAILVEAKLDTEFIKALDSPKTKKKVIK